VTDERYDLVFRMRQRARSPDPIMQIRDDAESYALLRKWKGEEEALGWIRSRVPENVRNRGAEILFERHRADLLWTLVDKPEAGPHPEGVWIMRGTAWARFPD